MVTHISMGTSLIVTGVFLGIVLISAAMVWFMGRK